MPYCPYWFSNRSSRHSAIIAFMMNAMNTIYSDDTCRAWFIYARGSRWFFLGREGLPRSNVFINSWMAWFDHIGAGSLLWFSLVVPVFSFLHSSQQRIFLIHISSSQQILFL